jgi:membrane protein YdbS with pleckstrin-like domain
MSEDHAPVVWEGRPAWSEFIFLWFFAMITRHAVHRTTGIRGRVDRAIPLNSITSVEIERGPLDRLFGIGAVVLYLKEGEGRRERIAGIKDPEVVYRKMTALL